MGKNASICLVCPVNISDNSIHSKWLLYYEPENVDGVSCSAKRFEFFKCMGMRENQLKWNTFFEIKILGRIAESVSLVTGILYVGAFIHKQKLAGGISNVFFKLLDYISR